MIKKMDVKVRMLGSILTILAALMVYRLSQAGPVPCAIAVEGCHQVSGEQCVFYAYNFRWFWYSSFKCNGSNYVPGTFSCLDGPLAGCCQDLVELSCPPAQCPCPG